MPFKVIPIPTEIAESVRATGSSPFSGHPAHVHVASEHGYGPCRVCLGRTRGGEKRILFTYNPDRGGAGIPFSGPIVVHHDACRPFAGEGFPEELRGLPFALCGRLKGGAGTVFDATPLDAPEAAIEAMFANPDVDHIDLRNVDPDSACFVARIERA
ncbi:MAG TPA: DUF1203 domain-containing protein [Holophagaceae bacterium]|nr:DUF1203 domain-containing protein [Holophagaceae bacterium]